MVVNNETGVDKKGAITQNGNFFFAHFSKTLCKIFLIVYLRVSRNSELKIYIFFCWKHFTLLFMKYKLQPATISIDSF